MHQVQAILHASSSFCIIQPQHTFNMLCVTHPIPSQKNKTQKEKEKEKRKRKSLFDEIHIHMDKYTQTDLL